ncbi:MAG: hypothetical protein J6W19_08310 [Prevotella sp.]|nr:hypothetical protein [Prevotella sp.]
MKILKTLLALAIVLMIVIIMAQTVPSKDRHKEAMMKAVTEFVESESEERGIADNVLTRLGKNVVVKAVETALNSKLKVHNYYVLNTTYVVLKGEEQMLSLGVLGMVFTFDKDMLHEKLQEALKGNNEEAVTEKEAAKQSAKELRKLEREKKKLEREQEKEKRKQEKAALKEKKRQEKEALKEQKRREKEARKKG